MTHRTLWIGATLAALATLSVPPRAHADDPKAPAPRVLTFGDGTAQFTVERDPKVGVATFTLTDPSIKLTSAPTVVVTTEKGPRTVTLISVEGKTGAWRLSDEVVKAETVDATMHIVVNGKTLSTAIPTAWEASWVTTETKPAGAPLSPKWVAMHGGRVVELVECNMAVEIVQQPTTGTLTVYAVDGVALAEAPIITVPSKSGSPETLTLTKVEGQNGAWTVTREVFKTEGADATIKVSLNGKPCEAPLLGVTTGAALHGGEIIVVEGGPRFEVVRDPAGVYTFYALDEMLDGKVYTIESPVVLLNVSGTQKSYALTPVSGQTRVWRLAGVDSSTNASIDGTLKFSISGKPFTTRLNLIPRERQVK